MLNRLIQNNSTRINPTVGPAIDKLCPNLRLQTGPVLLELLPSKSSVNAGYSPDKRLLESYLVPVNGIYGHEDPGASMSNWGVLFYN